MLVPRAHPEDTLRTRLCLACLTGQTVLTRAMQKNKKIGTQFPATLDVLLSYIKDDLKKVCLDWVILCWLP